jgi:type II secretory pathway pseudopilin PulG
LRSDELLTGFTLLELIIAAFVIAVALIAAMSLIHRAVLGAQIASSRLTAAYLAKEGLEIVRNIRDSNWLEQRDDASVAWDKNLGTGNWEADFNDFALIPYGDRKLKIDGGFYNYDSGTDTDFKRAITITKPSSYILAVSVSITWEQRGVPYALSIQENLYDWK